MKIAVTGLGAITALGADHLSTWKALCEGKHGIKNIPYWDKQRYKTKIAGCATDFKPDKIFTPKQLKQYDYAHQLAIAAAKMALDDSGINSEKLNKKRAGIFIGTSLSGMISGQQYHQALLEHRKINPRLIHHYPMSVLLDRLTEVLGFLGPRSLISTACTASTIAIAHAVEALRLGQAEVILAGGVDPLCELSFAGFSSMQNMSAQPCAPFSLPLGLSLGEGAGMLILENMENALHRGARIYAELAGYGLTTDAYHLTSPDISAQGQKRLIYQALKNSNAALNQIDYINTHGTGTNGNDLIEAKALHLIWGEAVKKIPVSSVKGAIGHTLGAAGAIEAVLTTLAVYHNTLPPTANFTGVRAGCELDHIISRSRSCFIHTAVTQNFAFGGSNAALVIRQSGKTSLTKNNPVHIQTLKRVVITGIGILSPVGLGLAEFHENLKLGKSGISEINYANKHYIGGMIKNFDPQTYVKADFRRIDRIGALTICAIAMALRDAGLEGGQQDFDQTGIIAGTACGPLESTRQFHTAIALGEPSKANPGLFPNTVLNAGIGLAAIYLKLKGPGAVMNIGQASGLRAVAYGYDLVRTGQAARIIAGGADELSAFKLQAYETIKKHKLSELSCPFDARRKNFIPGEGSCFLVLESLETALERKAPIWGEIKGHECCADTPVYRGWDPSGEGLIRSMQGAVKNAGLLFKSVDFISAGALSDQDHDPIEARAINYLDKTKSLPVSAFSSAAGVSAATAPMGLAAGLLGLKHHFMPMQVNYDYPDPLCPLAVVNKILPDTAWNTMLVNSVSMGGGNVSLIVQKYKPALTG